MTYYCPHCWAETPAGAQTCPTCGSAIENAQADIADKYIAALHHPQAETRLRAAWMLGRMQEARTIPLVRNAAMAALASEQTLNQGG